MTTVDAPVLAGSVREPAHVFTRHGRALAVRVVPIGAGGDLGHALIFGDITQDCLVRIHSRCLYGDALRSDDCDCGPELEVSMDMIQAEGRGVLCYLEQEGRGAGLIGKAMGYALSQREHIDTFTSYEKLGFPPDSRCYRATGELLKSLGLRSIRLLTNNPDKESQLRAAGLMVSPVALHIEPRNREVFEYLQAKRLHRGHRLPHGWGAHRLRRVASSLALVTVVGGACAGVACGAVLMSGSAPDRGLLAAVAFSAAAGVLAGRWAPSRTRFLRARCRLALGRRTRA